MGEGPPDKYAETINALTIEAIRCSPPSWTSGMLSIDCDGRAINYKLKSERQEDRATLSDDLRLLCEQLYVVMRDNGDDWREAILSFEQKEKDWSMKTEFKYANSDEN